MSANSNLVLAGTAAGGASGLELLWVAPTGTTAPTDATTALHASFQSLGYVSSDGVTLGREESNEDILAYGTGVPVRTLNTQSKTNLQLVLLETSEAVLEVYNRLELGTITPDADGDFAFGEGSVPTQRYAFVLDVVDGTNRWRRYYPAAEVTDRQEIQVRPGAAITYGLTITAYPGSDGDAVKNFYRIPELASGS